MTTTVHYIARCQGTYEDKPLKPDEWIWLSWSPEGGGWNQCSTVKGWAKKFESPEDVKKQAKSYDGMPWYYKTDLSTMEIFKVEETHTRVETSV